MAPSKLQRFWNHPAGPKTIHFWAPAFKWALGIANVVDATKPPEQLSYPQQSALSISSCIWARYSMVVIPKNWNLFSVSVATGATSLYQLTRKIRHDFSTKNEAGAAKEY